jgi:hypothetical protein
VELSAFKRPLGAGLMVESGGPVGAGGSRVGQQAVSARR